MHHSIDLTLHLAGILSRPSGLRVRIVFCAILDHEYDSYATAIFATPTTPYLYYYEYEY